MSKERKDLMIKLMTITDISELRMIRNAINDRIKEVAGAIKYRLRKDDKVVIDNGRQIKETGVIVKVNRTKAVVNIDGKQWNVPFTMITKEQENK